MMLLTDRYVDKILGLFSCFDRVVMQGTIPKFCRARGGLPGVLPLTSP
jgi:hypothetical protein